MPLFPNLKVHFAGCEVMNQYYAVQHLGVNYTLYTVFPFLERIVLKTKQSPIMPCHLKENPFDIPKYIAQNSKHCIQDSGLFTLMFGSHKGNHSKKSIYSWYDGLIDFTKQNNNGATIVEVDCQKVLGVDEAWALRKKMKDDLPNKQINVFHKEDGQKGLDRLIEFSDYIAISVPELRFLGKKKSTIEIAHYIKNKKPLIDIHLLGCTERGLIENLKFCTSCDSTSYIGGKRYGHIKGRHINTINTKSIIEIVGQDKYNLIRQWNNETNTNFLCLSIEILKKEYTKYAGNQD